MNNLKPVFILEPGGRRRSGLYADIPVPVIQVPAGEEAGHDGFSILLKKEKEAMEENDEEKEEE